ncbi:hypothetical protein MMC26_002162 [Xylographa opegraphella]|nr:hypothetical protein [Xylographa opegraphella]
MEHPEPQNRTCHEDDPLSLKTILKQIHSRLHLLLSRQYDDPRDPEAAGAILKLMQRACRKLHIGKECKLDESGACYHDQVQILKALLMKSTTSPITEEDQRIMNKCIDSMSDAQKATIESWVNQHRDPPPGYPERAGDEAQASGSTPGPSRRVGSQSNDTNIAEHAEQGGDVAASGSASRPSRRVESDSHDTDIAEHAENFEQGGDAGEASTSNSRPLSRVVSASLDTNVAGHAVCTEQGADEGEASGSASRSLRRVISSSLTTNVAEQGANEGVAPGSASRPSRRGGSGSHNTNVAEYLENVELGGSGREAPRIGPRHSGQEGCVARHIEYAQPAASERHVSRPSSGQLSCSASGSRATNNNTHASRSGNQSEASGSASRPARRAALGSYDSEDDEEAERSGRTTSVAELVQRVCGKLHIS